MANLINPRGSPLQTYDYWDTITGTTFKRYYASAISGATNQSFYKLVDTPIYSELITLQISGCPSNDTKSIQVRDFDLRLDVPQIVEGNVFINATTGIKSTTGVATNKTTWLIVTIQQSGATLCTDLISGATSKHFMSDPPLQTIGSMCHALKLETPRTLFKKGDYFKVHVDQWATDNGEATYGFGCDPMNRSDATIMPGAWSNCKPNIKIINTSEPTIFIVDIPFKLQV